MSFNIDKFNQLSILQQLKKLSYHLRNILIDKKTQNPHLYKEMITYINQKYYYSFPIPENKEEVKNLYEELTKRILEKDPYQESIIFDSPNKKRTIFNIHLVLDNIRSPFNVGSLFRTSECLGVRELILLGITPRPDINTKIQKSAKDGIISYRYFENAALLKQNLTKQDIFIGIEKTNNSKDITLFKEPNHDCNYYLVMGNEEFGISKDVLDICQDIYHIPLMGMKNSLNVSVAGGIALYHIKEKLTPIN